MAVVDRLCCPLYKADGVCGHVTCLLPPLKISSHLTRWAWEHSCGYGKINETCLMLPCPLEMPMCTSRNKE